MESQYPKLKKQEAFLVIVAIGIVTALAPLSVDLYLSAFKVIASDLSSSIERIQDSMTVYLFGFAFAQLIYGPIADSFGRFKTLFFGFYFMFLVSLFLIFVKSIESLLLLRFLQALGVCAGSVVTRAVVSDLFPPKEAINVYSSLMLVMGIAPITAPLLGAYIASFFGWRYIFAFLAIYAFLSPIVLWFAFPKNIVIAKEPFSLKNVIKNYFKLSKNLPYMRYVLFGSCGFSALFIYITGAPKVFLEHYGLNQREFGYIFSLGTFGFILGSQITRFIFKYIKPNVHISFALPVLFFLSLLLSLLSFLQADLSLLVPVLALTFFMFGTAIPPSLGLAMSYVQPSTRGSASAFFGFFQFFLPSIFTILYNRFVFEGAWPVFVALSFCFLLAMLSFFLLASRNKKI